MKTEIIKRATAKEVYGFTADCRDEDEEGFSWTYTEWKGAHWKDWCEHAFDDSAMFHGTFLRKGVPHDVYTFDSDFKHHDNWDRGVCIRYGGGVSETITPGAIFQTNGMLRTALSNSQAGVVYATALELIGIISPEIGSFIRELDEKGDD